jgi:2-polyprenyl-3-methyl-5-hydroxy-6-metoxy-1,4-benzoquinol methylase
MQKDEKIFYFHQCINCDLIFLFNPPNKHNMDKYYDSNYWPYLGNHSFGKYRKFVNLGQMSIDNKRVNIVIKNCKQIDTNFHTLDFGCGNPTFLNTLQNKTNAHCIGYDVYSHGWENSPSEYKDLNLISGEIEQLESATKFDLITLWHTLEHEFHPNQLIQFFNKVTKEDATIIIEVPNYHSITRKLQHSYWAGYHTPRHSVVFTPNTLIELMKKNGWRLHKLSLFGTLPAFTLWWLGYFDKKMKKKNANIGNLEKYFWNFLILKIILFPFFMFEKFFSYGVMTAVFKKNRPEDERGTNC